MSTANQQPQKREPDEDELEDVDMYGAPEEQQMIEMLDDEVHVTERYDEDEVVEQDQVYDLPLKTLEELEEFDGIMATDTAARETMICYFESFVCMENTFKDMVRKIVNDEVLVEYSEQKGDLRNLHTFSMVLKEAYSKQKDAKNYWRRIDALCEFFRFGRVHV